MPVLGQQPRKSNVGAIAVAAAVIGLVLGGVYWATHRGAADEAPPAPVLAPIAAAPVEAPPEVTPTAPSDGLATATVTINGPLETALVDAVGKEVGAPLTQVVTRSLVWWVRVPQDLMKGDALSVVYETRPGQEPLVHALRFTSGKLGRTLESYRFQSAGSAFARYYQPDGTELEERLVDGPLDDYEQVTSLLRDGRRHKGVDFKTPAGTPVKATFDGVIARKNWNFRGNGNCLEVRESGGQGRTALFLHLSEVPKTVEAGQRVKKGQVIAESGNTGHSFAPHLHYQLMKGDRVIDPFESHATTRRALPATDRAAFDVAVTSLGRRLGADVVAGAR